MKKLFGFGCVCVCLAIAARFGYCLNSKLTEEQLAVSIEATQVV